mgnify:CR=1 FL=1
MRKSRSIYFNDARHYYLFVFDPPMRLEDAWRPVDEVSGTAVDTFVYGVSRGDTGLFFPSEVGMRFGADLQPFQNAYEWRSWENMESLISRGLDPLTVLIDRAHEKNMEFFASVPPAFSHTVRSFNMIFNFGGLFLLTIDNHQFNRQKQMAVCLFRITFMFGFNIFKLMKSNSRALWMKSTIASIILKPPYIFQKLSPIPLNSPLSQKN